MAKTLKPPTTPAQLRRAARERFNRVRRAEITYSRQLTHVGRSVGQIIKGFGPDGEVTDMPGLMRALEQYAAVLQPWAKQVTARMQLQVANRERSAWIQLGRTVGRELRKEIDTAPTGAALRDVMAEQVHLITSIPTEAAQRVHMLTLEGITKGRRAKEVQSEILYSTHVAVSRAKTIARTEVARTASVLTQVRAQHIGSEGYLWRTAEDTDVRKLHKRLEGKFIPWNRPPVAGSQGERAHAGQIYNCRCWPEPVLPDTI